MIDGKVLRGSIDKVKGKHATMILNAIDAATSLVVAQLAFPGKECEITAIPKLLDLLDIQGSVITTDAIETQTETMSKIVEMD